MTWAAEQFAGDVQDPGAGVEPDQVGAQRAVVSHGRRVVDARVAQQRRVRRQLEVDERQVRARRRLVEETVSAGRHVLDLELRVRAERVAAARRRLRATGVDQARQRLRIARLTLCIHQQRLSAVASSVFTCIGALGTPSRTETFARKYLPGFPYS